MQSEFVSHKVSESLIERAGLFGMFDIYLLSVNLSSCLSLYHTEKLFHIKSVNP